MACVTIQAWQNKTVLSQNQSLSQYSRIVDSVEEMCIQDLMAFVFTGTFLLPLGPAELTLALFEVCANSKIRTDALEWVGKERRRELIKRSHF